MRKSAFTALAIATLLSSAAIAQPGNGNGKGNGGGNGKGNGKPAAAGQAKPGKAMKAQNRGAGPQVQRQVQRIDRGPPARVGSNGNGNGNGNGKIKADRPVTDVVRSVDRDVRRVEQRVRYVDASPAVVRTISDGCPPGLAKKFNGCTPPGLAKKQVDVYYDRPDWWGYSGLSSDRTYYRNGYLLSLNRDNRISGFVPLLAGALGLGEVWPDYYEPQRLDPYYSSYFDLGPTRTYRYADDVIYRVDPQTSVINSVAALLTGDDFTVGNRMPAGYDVYNVPYDYRDRYYDTPDAQYRYADGYIYEVDPTTQLIAAAISLLT